MWSSVSACPSSASGRKLPRSLPTSMNSAIAGSCSLPKLPSSRCFPCEPCPQYTARGKTAGFESTSATADTCTHGYTGSRPLQMRHRSTGHPAQFLGNDVPMTGRRIRFVAQQTAPVPGYQLLRVLERLTLSLEKLSVFSKGRGVVSANPPGAAHHLGWRSKHPRVHVRDAGALAELLHPHARNAGLRD